MDTHIAQRSLPVPHSSFPLHSPLNGDMAPIEDIAAPLSPPSPRLTLSSDLPLRLATSVGCGGPHRIDPIHFNNGLH
jgi:hypothetical protein